MKRLLRNFVYGFFILSLWVTLYGTYQLTHKEEFEKKDKLASILEIAGKNYNILSPTKFSDCQIQGPLPDNRCTPGAVFEDASIDKICQSGYTKTVRNVSTTTRKKVYSMYSINYPPEFGTFELDHLIPLALGGNNEVANLFPEAKTPPPGFKEKDVVEIYLYEEVCKGNIDLREAEAAIAKDWIEIYNNISPSLIESIREKYKSWAN